MRIREWSPDVCSSDLFFGDESTTDVMLSGPLTDTLKGRIALRYRNMVGWMHNTAQAIANPFNPAYPFADPPKSRQRLGDREFLGRVSLSWDPAPNFSSKLKVTVEIGRASCREGECQSV